MDNLMLEVETNTIKITSNRITIIVKVVKGIITIKADQIMVKVVHKLIMVLLVMIFSKRKR